MDDIVRMLRAFVEMEGGDFAIINEAADEIERGPRRFRMSNDLLGRASEARK